MRQVINTSTGEIIQKIDYDNYGNVSFDSNPGFIPFGYAGGLYDNHTKLVRFGERDYDAISGRWTAKDPIGFEGNVNNLFEYVYNDAINYVDPKGEDAFLAFDFIVGAIYALAVYDVQSAGILVGAATIATIASVGPSSNTSFHASEQMMKRGITPKMIDRAIAKGVRYYDPKNKVINYVLEKGFASGKDLLVGMNPISKQITTVIRGWGLVAKRFIPL